jgi:hypothetical protein
MYSRRAKICPAVFLNQRPINPWLCQGREKIFRLKKKPPVIKYLRVCQPQKNTGGFYGQK